MNYNSIQEIFDAGTTNMTVIRDNSYNDGAWDSISAPDWLMFNGNKISTVYVSGNSEIGFNSQTQHFVVNYRDTSSYYVYREEGTLYNYYRFIKIRWRGYSYWNQPYDDRLQEYDVILWDTGDISLHMVRVPSVYWENSFWLKTNTTYNYTKPTTSTPDVTFLCQDENRSQYTIAYEPISLLPPFDRRYLIRSDGIMYTVLDGQLFPVEVTDITSAVFIEHGVEEMPVGSLLLGLHNPELLYWQDSDLPVGINTAFVTATSPPELIISNKIDLTHATITGIEKAIVTCEGEPLFCVSFDNKQTWKAWNGSEWSTVSEVNSGMTKELFESIDYDNWMLLYNGADSFYIKVILNANELTQSVTNIYMDFAN